MIETPLARLSRVVGGLALGYGTLGHQVLGQLLITDERNVELAAALVFMAASSEQKDAGLQAAIRILAPAIALQWLATRQEERIEKLLRLLKDKQVELGLVDDLHGRARRSQGRRTPRRATRGQ